MKRKVTKLALYRLILGEERDHRESARKCAKSKDPYDRKEMVQCYTADADEYKELAGLVKDGKFLAAYRYWEKLDTIVREGVSGAYLDFLISQAAKEHNAKKTNRRTNRS